MGVDKLNAGVFVHQMLNGRNQRQVFEHIGMVAGMKGVAVTEHGGMVTGDVARKLRQPLKLALTP